MTFLCIDLVLHYWFSISLNIQIDSNNKPANQSVFDSSWISMSQMIAFQSLYSKEKWDFLGTQRPCFGIHFMFK
jgi:hypothetical protein